MRCVVGQIEQIGKARVQIILRNMQYVICHAIGKMVAVPMSVEMGPALMWKVDLNVVGSIKKLLNIL